MAIHQISSFSTKIEIALAFFLHSPQMHGRRKKLHIEWLYLLGGIFEWKIVEKKSSVSTCGNTFSSATYMGQHLWDAFTSSLPFSDRLILRNTEDRICSCAYLALLVPCSSECYTEDWQRHQWSLKLLSWVGLSAIEILPKHKRLTIKYVLLP